MLTLLRDGARFVPPGGMSAAQIKQVLSGKSWKWASPKNSGVTLYADDGSSLVEVTGKGTTTGKWSVKDGQLCESFCASTLPAQGRADDLPAASAAPATPTRLARRRSHSRDRYRLHSLAAL